MPARNGEHASRRVIECAFAGETTTLTPKRDLYDAQASSVRPLFHDFPVAPRIIALTITCRLRCELSKLITGVIAFAFGSPRRIKADVLGERGGGGEEDVDEARVFAREPRWTHANMKKIALVLHSDAPFVFPVEKKGRRTTHAIFKFQRWHKNLSAEIINVKKYVVIVSEAARSCELSFCIEASVFK